MKEIHLTRGKIALVDDTDYERVAQFKWWAKAAGRRWYALHTMQPERKSVFMHRFILDAQPGIEVDHVDGDGLNNTRDNLRLASKSQNMFNRDKQTNNTSGYKGVSWDRITRRWRAAICSNGVHFRLGRFDTPQEAARAYDTAARELFGEFARLNFPESK